MTRGEWGREISGALMPINRRLRTRSRTWDMGDMQQADAGVANCDLDREERASGTCREHAGGVPIDCGGKGCVDDYKAMKACT